MFRIQIPRAERRLAPRLNVKVPVRVRIPKSKAPEQWGESLNLSQRGICLATDLSLQKGSAVQLTFEMPEEVSKRAPSEWRCTGHVVHVQQGGPSQWAICLGIAFDCYEVLPLAQSSMNQGQNGSHS